MEDISLQQKQVEADTKQQMDVINAKQAQNVKVIHAEGIKAQAEKKANKIASEILAEA